MNTVSDLAKEGGNVISKAGPWAVLSLLLIFGLGYEGHLLINHFAARVSSYVETSDRNLTALLEAQRVNAEAHAILTTSVSMVAITLAENTKAQAVSAEDIRELQTIMVQTYEILRKSPGTTAPALDRLKQSVDRLSDGTLTAPTLPAKTPIE